MKLRWLQTGFPGAAPVLQYSADYGITWLDVPVVLWTPEAVA